MILITWGVMMVKSTVKGIDLFYDPLLNKGTAFSIAEREKYHLFGLLPCNVETLEEQVARCKDAYVQKPTPLEKHIYLRALQDCNEVLFYRFILQNLEEMLPIIYTPVVGDACEMFHKIYRRPRGLFLAYPEKERIDEIFEYIAKLHIINIIVVTDGERILGLGDQGAGGLGIPIGKLSLYTSCGGIDPATTLPIVLDVGTNNQERLNDPEYLGWRHERITGAEYDAFVDIFVQSVKKHFPNVLLQFEDFAQQHAYPLLKRYQNQLCAFNDDIQGTASVAAAAIHAAIHVSKVPLADCRIALLGAGSAGCGISEQIVHMMVLNGVPEQEARKKFYLVDKQGLLCDDMDNLAIFQKPFAQKAFEIRAWKCAQKSMTLKEVIDHAKPNILLGVSGQPGQFTEEIIRKMSSYCERPIVLPLSNPTSRAEATPEDILRWSDGKALVATGSPFDPVKFNGRQIEISQCNNAYIFPGVGLGIVAGKIPRVTDSMMLAAAMALSELAPAKKGGEGRLLPELADIRSVSQHIAKAIIRQAIKENIVGSLSSKEIDACVQSTMWNPTYEPI